MEEITLKVEGMKCEGCENTIKNSLNMIKKIRQVIPNHKEGTVKLKIDKDLDINIVKEKIENLGFEVK